MKTAAVASLRRKLAADQPVFGLWVTLESPSLTEMAVALGLDWVVLDAEHGHLDWKDLVEHLRAAVRSQTVVLIRVAELNVSLIKRALDIGADGVVVPWVETVEQVRQAVAFARYPLEGVRGIGGERATAWGQALVEHTAEANEHVLVVPILETVRTRPNVEAMCKVDGVELFFFGPADYSSTAGHRGQWEGPGVAEQILSMKDIIRKEGKNCGLLTTSHEDLHRRLEQGFRVLGLGSDAGLFLRGLRGTLAAVGRDRVMRANLDVAAATLPPPMMERPPESARPDRPEVMTPVGAGPKLDLERGVRFEALVGGFNNARNLTTGFVTFQPGAGLPPHTHPFSESITVIRGRAEVEVEGRCHTLGRFDNVTIPAGIVHAARNATGEEVILHIAMASHAPTRTLVETTGPRRVMPSSFGGVPGAERVTRYQSAARGSAGPNTEFIDFFNEELMPGLEMSGGFGLFHPGGRLPAHFHDFDESICIVDGSATCIVDGRRHSPGDGATALVPRGRVHYFVNTSDRPMTMIWVYAGPRPERIVVDEKCATPEGNPWR
jgi:2-keto-3-deoxy-L-rhamnonate aldolase RhmA/quercetin dioxygenase-like cupin family protein